MEHANDPANSLSPKSSTTKPCARCGVSIPTADKFCLECGAPQSPQQETLVGSEKSKLPCVPQGAAEVMREGVPEPSRTRTTGNKYGLITLAIVGVVILVVGGLVGWNLYAPKQLSVLGIRRGETIGSAVQAMNSMGFSRSNCSKPSSNALLDIQCFKRGTDEVFSLFFKEGKLEIAGYQFSGSKYDSIWNALYKRYGKPRAYLGDCEYRLADIWQDDSMKDEIKIMKVFVDGTGNVVLSAADDTLKGIAVKFSSSPDECSAPISGHLQPIPEGDEIEAQVSYQGLQYIPDGTPANLANEVQTYLGQMVGYKIRNLRMFVNRKNGALTITFDCQFGNGQTTPTQMLVRLFDANGAYLTHFVTEEWFVAHNARFTPPYHVIRLQQSQNSVQYSVNIRDAAYAQKAEFGWYLAR